MKTEAMPRFVLSALLGNIQWEMTDLFRYRNIGFQSHAQSFARGARSVGGALGLWSSPVDYVLQDTTVNIRGRQPAQIAGKHSVILEMSSLHSSDLLIFCSIGSYAPPGSSACILCSPGTYSLGSAAVCSLCSLGQFQNMAGQSTCNFCQAGTYQALNGSAECTPCPYDFSAKEKQLLYFKDCRSCFSANSSLESSISCCNSTEEETVFLNFSSLRIQGSAPGILSAAALELLINSALASQKNIFNLVGLYQDLEAWSIGNTSGMTITIYLHYGGFQMRFDQYSTEYFGFQTPVPPNGPTLCANKTLKPFYLDGCMPCLSDYSAVAPQIASALKSRYRSNRCFSQHAFHGKSNIFFHARFHTTLSWSSDQSCSQCARKPN